jgi:hypothetical protein
MDDKTFWLLLSEVAGEKESRAPDLCCRTGDPMPFHVAQQHGNPTTLIAREANTCKTGIARNIMAVDV